MGETGQLPVWFSIVMGWWETGGAAGGGAEVAEGEAVAEHTPTAVPATRGSTTDSLDSSGTVPPASGNDNNGGIFFRSFAEL